MSYIGNVLKNKNKLTKEAERRRHEAIRAVKSDALYMMQLSDDLNNIDMLFEDENVKEVHITVKDKHMSKFMKAKFSERMSEYDITILKDYVVVRRRVVDFY